MSNKATAVVFSDVPIGEVGCDNVRYLNPRYWDGRIFDVDVVYTDREEIASAHREQGISVYPIHREVKSASESTESEIEQIEKAEVPQESYDYEDMSWPKLKSLASSMTEGKVRNKKEALEVLRNQG